VLQHRCPDPPLDKAQDEGKEKIRKPTFQEWFSKLNPLMKESLLKSLQNGDPLPPLGMEGDGGPGAGENLMLPSVTADGNLDVDERNFFWGGWPGFGWGMGYPFVWG